MWLLLVWLVARSILPAGFMPGPEGGLVACRSAAVISADEGPLRLAPAEHVEAPCLFAADALPPVALLPPSALLVALFFSAGVFVRLLPSFQRPLAVANGARAPPHVALH